MGRLGVYSGPEVCALHIRHGFAEGRRRGSHIVMQKRQDGTTVTVPVPDHKDILTGTLQSIIRQSGLPRSIFEVG